MWHIATWGRAFARLKSTALVVLATACSAFAAAAGPDQRPTVLELFTSQGCSSCPSADALFESYAKRPGVIALSFSVHYWDSLGWKDTLANPRFTYRQKAYAKARGDGQVYTPQVVVNGHNHIVGSDRAAIDAGTKAAQNAAWLPLKLTRTANAADLEIPARASWKTDTVLWLATVTRRVEVMVKRGENAGRTLTYFNAVRSFDQIGQYLGEPLSISLDARAFDQSEVDQVVVLAQFGNSGPIVGAATLVLKP